MTIYQYQKSKITSSSCNFQRTFGTVICSTGNKMYRILKSEENISKIKNSFEEFSANEVTQFMMCTSKEVFDN